MFSIAVYQITTDLSGLKQHPFYLIYYQCLWIMSLGMGYLDRIFRLHVAVIKVSAGAVGPCKRGLGGWLSFKLIRIIGRIRFLASVELTVASIFFSANRRKSL